MNGRTIAGHITALTVVLIGALIGCGVAPTPAPTPDPEGNGDPILSKMPSAPLLESVSMPFTRVGTRADTPAEIKLSFARSMNRESVEQAVNLYPAEIKRNDGTPKRLQVKAICDGGWQIRNPNSSSVSFNWSISKSVERGEGMVAANGEQTLFTTRGYKQLRLSVNNVLQTRVLSVSSACAKTLEFAWAEDNKSVTVKLLKPMASDAITVSLSTAAFSSDGTRMVEPSSETLVPEQIIQANQPVSLQFSQAVNKVTLESSLKLYQGKFDSYDALEPSAPRVINTCDGSYTVKNPNTQPLSFTWNIEGSSEKGTGNVAALSETKVTPSSNARAIKVFTQAGINVTRSLEESSACNVSFSSVWDASSASVKLSASSLWKLGSYTVTGKAVNDAGARVARDRLAVVHVVQDDTNGGGGGGGGGGGNSGGDDVEPEPLLRADVDQETFPIVATAGEPTNFSGFASGSSLDNPNSTEPSITWEFGDGSSGTGLDVEHIYPNPGEYRVTTRVTNSSGVSDSVTQNVQVLPSAEQIIADADLTGGNDTFNWDLGDPITGLQYTITFTNTNKQQIATSNATRGSQRFDKLGMYSMRLSVMDYRDDPVQARTKRTTNPEEILNRTLIQRDVRLNRWELQPIPTVKAISSNVSTETAWREQLVGEAPLSVDFDGSASQGEGLTYIWRSCQIFEGACDPISEKTGVQPRFDFSEPGEYQVEMIITDRFGQQATQQTYVVAKTKNMNFMTPRFDFSTAPGYENLIGGNSIVTTGVSSIPGDIGGVPTGEAYFPFVMHRSVKFNRAGIRWNPWERGNNFRRQKCVSIKGYHNGREFFPNKFLSPDVVPDIPPSPDLNDYLNYSVLYDSNATYGLTIPECDLATMNNRDIPRVNAGSNQEIVVSGSTFIQRLHFDVTGDFRVPKLVLAVLPDDMVPGDANMPGATTKLVNEHTIELSGRKQLVLTVVMRASEVQRSNRKLEFDVPVYAVDTEGRSMPNVNGFFFAKFNNVESDCGACVMVDGKSKIRISINPVLYGVRDGQSPNTINLTTMTLSSDEQRCDGSSNESVIGKKLRLGLLGCAFIATSSEAPIGEETLEPINYWGLENNTSFGGNVYFGDYANAVENFRQFFSETLPDEISELLIGQIPVYGIGRAFVRGWVYCRASGCDLLQWGGVFLAGAGLAFELIPVVKTVFKLSQRAYLYSLRVGGGQFARALNDVIEPLAIVGKSASEIGVHLRSNYGRLIETLGKCVAVCGKPVDKLLELYKRDGVEASVALHEIDDLLVTAKNSRVREADVLEMASSLAKICTSSRGSFFSNRTLKNCRIEETISNVKTIITNLENRNAPGISPVFGSTEEIFRKMKDLCCKKDPVNGITALLERIRKKDTQVPGTNLEGELVELERAYILRKRRSTVSVELPARVENIQASDGSIGGFDIDVKYTNRNRTSFIEQLGRSATTIENKLREPKQVAQLKLMVKYAYDEGFFPRITIESIDGFSATALKKLGDEIRAFCYKSKCLDFVNIKGVKIGL